MLPSTVMFPVVDNEVPIIVVPVIVPLALILPEAVILPKSLNSVSFESLPKRI